MKIFKKFFSVVHIHATDEIKVKALKGLYFHQEIAKTEAQEHKHFPKK